MGMTMIDQRLVFVTLSPSVTAGSSPSLLLMAICALKRQKLFHTVSITCYNEKPVPIITFHTTQINLRVLRKQFCKADQKASRRDEKTLKEGLNTFGLLLL